MRVSTDDPGFYDAGIRYHVFLNGVLRQHVFRADEEAGFVVVAKTNERGEMRVNAAMDDVEKETLYGHVLIEPMEVSAA
jgi:hypothetical protein